MQMLWKCRCGHNNQFEDKYCPNCDTPQRDMQTIVFTDNAGPRVVRAFWKGVTFALVATISAIAGFTMMFRWLAHHYGIG